MSDRTPEETTELDRECKKYLRQKIIFGLVQSLAVFVLFWYGLPAILGGGGNRYLPLIGAALIGAALFAFLVNEALREVKRRKDTVGK